MFGFTIDGYIIYSPFLLILFVLPLLSIKELPFLYPKYIDCNNKQVISIHMVKKMVSNITICTFTDYYNQAFILNQLI